MSPAVRAYNAYRSAEVETLSQRDLLVKLYQGAERFLNQAIVAMRARQIESAHDNSQKAKRIFAELLSTLNFEMGSEIAGQLRDLYLFFMAEILASNMHKDGERLVRILPVIATLREAWQAIPEEFAATSSLPSGIQGQSLDLRT